MPNRFARSMRGSFVSPTLLAQDFADLEPALAAADLAGLLVAAALDFDEAALGVNGEAGRTDRRHLARTKTLHFTEGARDRLARIEEMEPPAIRHRPRAGRWIAAADEVVDGIDGVGPVDPRLGLAHPALVARAFARLRALLRLAGHQQIGGFEQRRHAGREDLVEIDAAQRVVGTDLDRLLQQYRPLVEAVHRAKDAEPRPLLAEDDRPVDRGRSAILRQQGRVELDRAEARHEAKALRHEVQHISHDGEIDLE